MVLRLKIWEKLNAGKEVEVDSIPEPAEEYVTEVKTRRVKHGS